MPYGSRMELPESVRKVLPDHAQEIYLNAFNNAWQQYADASKRRGHESREEVAQRLPGLRLKKSTPRIYLPGHGNAANFRIVHQAPHRSG